MLHKTPPAEEALLLNGLKRGEERFYRMLFDRYYQPLVIYANRMLLDIDLARSVVQDVFVLIFDKREDLHIHTSFNAHLYQSVKNRCLNEIKREKMKDGHHEIILKSSDGYTEAADELELNDLQQIIDQTVAGLPEQCRRIFVMSRHEGLSNQDIADQLQLSKRTVETQISKALRRLREELAQHQILPALLASLLVLFQ